MLSVKEIENSKPTDKPQKLFDGGGLYLEVSPAGGKPAISAFRKSLAT